VLECVSEDSQPAVYNSFNVLQGYNNIRYVSRGLIPSLGP
jgi:hypothetical protein